MMRLGLVLVLLAGAAAMAEEEDACILMASNYIAKHGTQAEEKKFEAKWTGMVQTAAASTAEEDEEHFLDRYIFDWMADRKGRFTANALTEEDKLQACRLYLIYKNLKGDGKTPRRPNGKAYGIPPKIGKYLTEDNVKKYVADEKIPSTTQTPEQKQASK